jgi:hypothetical protein
VAVSLRPRARYEHDALVHRSVPQCGRRLQLGFPATFSFIDPEMYLQFITMHGMIMVIYQRVREVLGGLGEQVTTSRKLTDDELASFQLYPGESGSTPPSTAPVLLWIDGAERAAR